mmetsp:Transcript_7910/g.15357  ORF Transcript_7910/g.15357 Transcript_7910/m.15357 type:complete len:191 (+) Transcript_7910:12609-13181(+)
MDLRTISRRPYPGARFAMVGNMYGFFFNYKAQPLILIGPHWAYFTCMFIVIAAVGFTFSLGIAPNISPLASYAGLGVICLCLLAYLTAAIKDPGIETRLLAEEIEMSHSSNDSRFCPVCEIVRKPGTEHCSDCDLCIRGYDHHCPWTSKCIGEGNLFYFHSFLILTLASIVYVVLVATFTTKAPHHRGAS